MATQTVYLSPITMIVQYLTNLGLLAAGGTATVYLAGTTSLATTYADSTGTVSNPNPMTLNSAGRPASSSGAPAMFWTLAGVALKLLVTDAAGNVLVGPYDQIPAINDLTNSTSSTLAQLASPASSNTSGSGPVAGADLVANAVKSYDIFTDVRAANAPSLAAGQTLVIEVQGGTAVGDGLGGTFYWSSTSSLADDGRLVLKPSVTVGAGRYLRMPQNPTLSSLCTADQSVTNSTTLVNSVYLGAATDLIFPAGTYLLSARLLFQGTGGTGQGYKVALNSTTGTTGPTNFVGIANGNGTPALVSGTIGNPGNAVTSTAISSTVGDACNFDVVVTFAGYWGYTVSFAQNSSSANATTLKTGSYVEVKRIA